MSVIKGRDILHLIALWKRKATYGEQTLRTPPNGLWNARATVFTLLLTCFILKLCPEEGPISVLQPTSDNQSLQGSGGL